MIPRNRRSGFVYFAFDGELIKIGHSRGPLHRVKHLRSPVKGRVKLIDYFAGYMDEEHYLHHKFAEHLAHQKEWFRDAPAIRQLIAELSNCNALILSGHTTIRDVADGKAPRLTPIKNIPREADRFHGWAEKETRFCPGSIQALAYRAWWGLKDGNHKPFTEFAKAYGAWAFPNTYQSELGEIA